jgi:hypothetical protein
MAFVSRSCITRDPVPILWLALGILADMIYLMVFYSMAVHWNASRYWRRRAL